MSNQERFAEDWGMPLADVIRLVGLAGDAFKANEHACNGDPFPVPFHLEAAPTKAQSARWWEARVEIITGTIADLVRRYGFTAVVYTGLGPTLKRGEQFVEVPY